MTRRHLLWLRIKTTLKPGRFSTILADKCDAHWYDIDCPNPATCYEYHHGSFGHRVVFLFCDKCWNKPSPLALLGAERPDRDRVFVPYPNDIDKLNKKWNKLISAYCVGTRAER